MRASFKVGLALFHAERGSWRISLPFEWKQYSSFRLKKTTDTFVVAELFVVLNSDGLEVCPIVTE